MAVLKMKKLRLIMHRSKRDELLRELICLACVELSSPDISGLEEALRPEPSRRAELEAKLDGLQQAIRIVEKNSSAVKRLHLGRVPQAAHVLLDDTGLSFALKKAGDLLSLNERLDFARREQQRLRQLIEELKDWQGVDAPLHLRETESCAVILGRLPLAADVEKLSAELEHIDEKSQLFVIKEDKKLKYIGLLCMKERAGEMGAALGAKGFLPAPHTDTPGSALQCSSDAAARIQQQAREEEHCKKLLLEESIHLEALQLAADRLSVMISLAHAEEKLYGTEATLLMQGWLPEKREAELEALFESYGCAYDISEPTAEEKADVPVLLESAAQQKPHMLRSLKLGLRRGHAFQPLEIRTKYYKLAE